jgi:hypothetical protein
MVYSYMIVRSGEYRQNSVEQRAKRAFKVVTFKGSNSVSIINNHQLNHVFPFIYYQSGVHISNRMTKESAGISLRYKLNVHTGAINDAEIGMIVDSPTGGVFFYDVNNYNLMRFDANNIHGREINGLTFPGITMTHPVNLVVGAVLSSTDLLFSDLQPDNVVDAAFAYAMNGATNGLEAKVINPLLVSSADPKCVVAVANIVSNNGIDDEDLSRTFGVPLQITKWSTIS